MWGIDPVKEINQTCELKRHRKAWTLYRSLVTAQEHVYSTL